PPCSQTITGRLSPRPRPFVHTFSRRQSSLIPVPGIVARTSGISVCGLTCGASGPQVTVSLIPVQASGRTGGRKRRSPAVEAPYGTPLNALTLSIRRPRIFPAVVSTVAPDLVSAPSELFHAPANTPAAAVPCARNLRRFIYFLPPTSFL